MLSNRGRFTVFEYGDTRLMIIAPKPLEQVNHTNIAG